MITETENHLPSHQGTEDGLMMLLHSRSLILSTAVTVVLERNALLIDVVYKLYTTVLDLAMYLSHSAARSYISRGRFAEQVRMRS